MVLRAKNGSCACAEIDMPRDAPRPAIGTSMTTASRSLVGTILAGIGMVGSGRPRHEAGAASALGLVLNLQRLAGLNQLPLRKVLLDPFRTLRQRRLVEQGQEWREPLAVDQPEDLDVALRR